MMLRILNLCFIVLTLLTFVNCDHDASVVELNDDNFSEKVKQGNYFVMFFAPWCGHCQRLHPLWDQLAEIKHSETDNVVKIAKVDCTQNKLVCSEHEITGYPTLRFFKQNSHESVKFKGTRDLPAFVSFINEQLNVKEDVAQTEETVPIVAKQKLVELTQENFAKHVSSGKHFVKFFAPWCSHCQNLAPTWEKLASELENESAVSIAKIDCTVYKPICQDFEVKGYPTLLWIENGKKIEKYSGARSLEVLQAYVQKMLGVNNSEAEEAQVKEMKSEDDNKKVITIVGDEFEKLISSDIAFIKFYAPWCGHCQKLSPVWDQLAEKVHTSRSDVKIGKVDCTDESNRGTCVKEQVQGYPTLNIYKNGEKLGEFDGTRSLPELENYIKKTIGHDEL